MKNFQFLYPSIIFYPCHFCLLINKQSSLEIITFLKHSSSLFFIFYIIYQLSKYQRLWNHLWRWLLRGYTFNQDLQVNYQFRLDFIQCLFFMLYLELLAYHQYAYVLCYFLECIHHLFPKCFHLLILKSYFLYLLAGFILANIIFQF